jgi:hypothetical protein
MQRAVFELEDRQLASLERLAASEGSSVDDLIRQAVDRFLAAHPSEREHWRERLDQAVATIRSGIPGDISSEEIEAEITMAREEVRQARRARGN